MLWALILVRVQSMSGTKSNAADHGPERPETGQWGID